MYLQEKANVTLFNTIVAGNNATSAGPDLLGTINSQGVNLIGNITGASGFSGQDLLNAKPLLGSLADNGGPTQTHALNPGSPAIDNGENNDAPATDQRGVARPQQAKVDIGAFEVTIGGRPGDFDNNNIVDDRDIDLLCQEVRSGNHTSSFDLTGDGQVDLVDHATLISDILNTTAGDSNLDGLFNTSDLVRVFQRGHYEDGKARNSGWADGDWNCDGEFDTSDLVAAFQAGSFERPARAANAGAFPTIDPTRADAFFLKDENSSSS